MNTDHETSSLASLSDSSAQDNEASTTAISVVGIGASAGGLEAFEQFFRHVPADSDMAFVLVSHLSPDHESLLDEILQRTTSMPVIQAQDQTLVSPNTVYIIPPNRDMTIFHGKLQLRVMEEPHAQRMPIDEFMRSLAEDQGEKAIGVILSGTGTDGTLGLRAIIGAGGIALVQEPTQAKYDGMPTSAIRAGYANHVLPVEKMPEVITSGARMHQQHRLVSPQPAIAGGIAHILMQLRTVTGHDFSQYKKSTITRRIERRMAQHNIEDAEVYVRYLKESPAEAHMLFRELLINVTSFFRDPEAFAFLQQDILPRIFKGKPENYVFRVWVAGCATGEEAYSIAILLREWMEENRRELKVQIYGTDLDDDAIAIARAGAYTPNIAQDVAPERLQRFFVKGDAGYQIKKEIREMVVFAVQNIIKDPPFTKLDLLACRNVMIYLQPELQNRLIPAFHYALKPGGVLFLSPSESIGNYTSLFTPLNRKWKFYTAINSAASTQPMMTGSLTWAKSSSTKAPEEIMQKTKDPNFAELTRRMLVQCFAPASVVTDLTGNVLYVHGETGKYLRPAPGKPSLNVIEMAREGLELRLRTAILAAAQGTPTLKEEVRFMSDSELMLVALSVRPVPNPQGDEMVLLVSFEDIAPPPKPRRKSATKAPQQGRIEELERELALNKENLRATIEEYQASNEELKSTNEEMQSTNEELQSTNEELETSKEELQSVNEELITVNAELQAKIEQLSGMQNDMKNLLDNISIGTIFLDEHMLIRRFTREATKVYRLVASDVGRALADINSNLEAENLLAEAQSVLETLVPFEQELRTTLGTWYLVRIQPYRTLENVIEGVVLTFTDITQRIKVEAAVQQAREMAENVVETIREPLLVLDGNLNIVSANRAFYQFFKVTPTETIGLKIYDLGNRQWNIPALRELLETILPRDQFFDGYVVEHEFSNIGYRKMSLNARRLLGKAEENPLILLAIENIGSVANDGAMT